MISRPAYLCLQLGNLILLRILKGTLRPSLAGGVQYTYPILVYDRHEGALSAPKVNSGLEFINNSSRRSCTQ